MKLQWYPGHMTKAVRQMNEDLKLIDLVIEIVDARIPVSGRNPDLDRMAQNKARMIILNKVDLADPAITKLWVSHFKELGIETVAMEARTKNGMSEVKKSIDIACKEKKERDLKRGIKNRPVRAMIVGIPNVGKSTFINSFSGKSVTKTGNKPGVTKGKQWIRLSKDVELLDTPGVLWPKFEDEAIGTHLAMIGSISENVYIETELAAEIINFFKENDPGLLDERYGVSADSDTAGILTEIAASRGCIKQGSEPDLEKAAKLINDEFKNGVIGRISIERP
ncbi:MAG: ribosome biogenesis GTPase YlqF [Lachnospiraceae bacterium]|nr:ribosome biogenesis GTPase YlqF [Lachnospiraceae bacterium]